VNCNTFEYNSVFFEFDSFFHLFLSFLSHFLISYYSLSKDRGVDALRVE
jgi:hypothetical protein